MMRTLWTLTLIASNAWASQAPVEDLPPQEPPATIHQVAIINPATKFIDNIQREWKERPQLNTSDARATLTNAAGTIRSIGQNANTEFQTIREECVRLDSENEAKDPAVPAIQWGGFTNLLTPFFGGNVAMPSLPRDYVNRFEHTQWALHLSRNNAGSAYLNIQNYNAQQLADGLYVSSTSCSGHGDVPGHYYAGANQCCQYYVRGLRRDLITTAAVASQHSRAHLNYVQEFERFYNQVMPLAAHYGTLWQAHAGVFAQHIMPAKPVNNYTAFLFSDWVLQLASNNNTPEIRAFTDLNNPAMMAEKVNVTCRHSACGGGVGHQYTSWNYCGVHHHRAVKIEMFNLVLELVRNQTNHDNYVREAQTFERSASAMMTNYWMGLQGWRGVVPTTVGNVVVQQPEHVRNNRSQLRGHLTRAMRALESAAQCTAIADKITPAIEAVITEVDARATYDSNNKTRVNMGTGLILIEIQRLEREVAELKRTNDTLQHQSLQAEEGMTVLKKQLQTGEWADREKSLREEFRLVTEKLLRESREKENKQVASYLGHMLYMLNMGRDVQQLKEFSTFESFQGMTEHARILITDPLQKLLARCQKLEKKLEKKNKRLEKLEKEVKKAKKGKGSTVTSDVSDSEVSD
jgi:hypothetical protein